MAFDGIPAGLQALEQKMIRLIETTWLRRLSLIGFVLLGYAMWPVIWLFEEATELRDEGRGYFGRRWRK